MKERIREWLLEAGADAVGFARAEPIDERVDATFRRWLESGCAASLDYLHRHASLRFAPENILPGVKTIVSTAWNYLPSALRSKELPFVARYAYGRDYHKAVRSLVRPVCRQIEERYGCATRICIDSAPLPERYWAVKAGIGFIGRNGMLIVPGKGSWTILCEILLTAELPPDSPCTLSCDACGACVKACPSGALGADGHVDCRRCLSSITVEGVEPPESYKGTLPLLGCDRCQEVCPHNRDIRPSHWMKPSEGILTLDASYIREMTEYEFGRRFAGTPFRRPGRHILLRNLSK